MRGHVVWIDLPQPKGTRTQLGNRPGVVLRSFPAAGLITVVPGTSSASDFGSRYAITLQPTRRNGLRQPTTFRAFQLMTLDRWRAVEDVGRLAPADFDALMDAVRRYIENQ